MVAKAPNKELERLPQRVTDFIKLVIKKMRYRQTVRAEVMAELAGHFEDELRDCKSDEEKSQKAEELIANFGDAKLLGVLLRRAKKRCRPLWQKALVRSFQAIGIIVVYIVICSGRLIVGTPTVNVNYAAWLNDLVRAGRSEDLNAKPYFDKAVELATRSPNLPTILEKCFSYWPGDMSDREQQAVKKLLPENRAIFKVLRKGVNKPYYWMDYRARSEGPQKEGLASSWVEHAEQRFWEGAHWPPWLIPAPPPEVRKFLAGYRGIAVRLAPQILWKAYVGDIEGAFDDYLVLQKFGYHLQGEGLLMKQLVGHAIRALAHRRVFLVLEKVDVPADVLKNLQKELEKQLRRRKIISLEGEKAFWYDFVQRTFMDDGKAGGRVLKEGLPMAVGDWKTGLLKLVFLSLPDRQEVMATIDEFFEQADRICATTPWQLHNQQNLVKEWNKTADKCFLLKTQVPSLRKAPLSGWAAEAKRRALLSVLAILRYQKEKGAYPADLEALVEQGYLSQPPMDPWSDRPLVYRKTKDGFILYSVGLNFKDDGGRVSRDYKGRVSRWGTEEAGDAVFWPAPKPETPEEREQRLKKERERRRPRRTARKLQQTD